MSRVLSEGRARRRLAFEIAAWWASVLVAIVVLWALVALIALWVWGLL